MQITVTSLRNDPEARKCPRCYQWHYIQENFGHPPEEEAKNPALGREKLCDRCQRVILEHFPGHWSVPHIRAALEAQRLKYRRILEPAKEA